MIRIAASEFRGLREARLDVAPIALVAGMNGAGKSSLAQAVAAALCGTPAPLAGINKSSAGLLVHTGAAAASIELAGDDGAVVVEWPSLTRQSQGRAPVASEFAAGLDSLATMVPEARARVLADYLKAVPTRADLERALAPTELAAPPIIEAVWSMIEQHGWDGAHKLRREKGAELKGRWRQITGMNYGSKIAEGWRPDLADEKLTEPELIAAVDDARKAHERAISSAAIAAVDRDRLALVAGELDQHNDALAAAEANIERLTGELETAQQARFALPIADPGATELPCPHCGGFVIVRQVSLVETRLEEAPPKLAPGELKARREAIAAADGKIAHATDALNQARRSGADARNGIATAVDARTNLDRLPAPSAAGGDAEAAKGALARAEKRLADFRMKREADDVHSKVVGNEILLELLAGDGLRATKLKESIEAFNTVRLAGLCKAAAWQPVTIGVDMVITYGKRPYPLCSTSEQYRVRVVLQVAMALFDGSDLIVIDAADVLDAPTRAGLFDLLVAARVPALVCMTASRPAQLPDLASIGLGASYWINAGVVEKYAREEIAA